MWAQVQSGSDWSLEGAGEVLFRPWASKVYVELADPTTAG